MTKCKKTKKWTPWNPHTGDECPVDGDEKMKIRFDCERPRDYACVHKPTMLNWSQSPCRHERITHYKRLISNVEAEEASPRTSKLSTKFDEKDSVGHHLNTPETKASEPETVDLDTTPKPIITDIGEYKTTALRRINIMCVYPDGTAKGNAYSKVDSDNIEYFECWWKLNGASLGAPKSGEDFDIMGPWEAPKTEKPEEKQAKTISADRVHIASVLLDGFIKGTITQKQEDELRGMLGAPALTHTEGEE